MPAVATAGGLPTRLGKYEIMMPLAAGGMARIYIGRSTGIGSFERHVVLKLILPERANDHTAVTMFLDEARLAASLNHQNVAQVFEVGEDAGIHYLAMEYVHGQDLRALLAKAGSQGTRVPLELALTVVAGAAAGLHHAHERRGADGVPLGIVHRDVSPSNIMIGYDGSVKLLDFGIAKATARSIETQAGIIKGKFAYMAPEQCRGREVDPRSDVFSLGIILYEISTQHRCFRADSDFDTMHRIVTGDVVRPTRLVQGYPQALEAIVMKALAVDPAQRYQGAGQLLEALEAFSVAARMSLSTMALGRFMRDMFGEVPEPWLTGTGRHPTVEPERRESTISNTNGSQERRPPTTLTPTNQSDVQVAAEPQPPRTILELPRGHEPIDEIEHEFEEQGVEWNAKSYPTMEPSYASSQTLPPEAMAEALAQRPSAQIPVPQQIPIQPEPAMLAPAPVGSQPLPTMPSGQFPAVPSGQFSAVPGSASASAPAIPIATHPGFQRADLSYPRYEPPPDLDEDVRITSRWPLVVGVLIVVVGLATVAVIAFWDFGSGSAELAVKPPPDQPAASAQTAPPEPAANPQPTTDKVEAPATAPDTTDTAADKPAPPAEVKAPEPPAPSAPDPADTPDDPMITVHVDSSPHGADVLIDAKYVGLTPLDLKLKRRTGSSTLVVHRPHYKDEVSKLDLMADFSKSVTLKRLVGEPAAPKTPPSPVTKAPPVHTKDAPKQPDSPKEPAKEPPKEPARDCQPQGQVNPFDTRPSCK